MKFLHLAKPAFEPLLRRELILGGHTDAATAGPGAESATPPDPILPPPDAPLPFDLCFATTTLADPATLEAGTVNGLIGGLGDYFATAFRDVRITTPWPLQFVAAPGTDGLGGRATVLAREWQRWLDGRMSRVAKLASEDTPAPHVLHRGLLVFVSGYDRLTAATRFQFWGQRRMKDDPKAPSRSYLKVEEAYGVLGEEPATGQTVADLGAAPGGWSYSAARHGARVDAVDNGPLKAGAAGNPLITHRREDAFTFRPAPGRRYDWLFCDMIENPYRVTELVERWVAEGWCRHFIVNLKFGHHDPVVLAAKLREPGRGLIRNCAVLRIRHLFHDREEITLVGRANS